MPEDKDYNDYLEDIAALKIRCTFLENEVLDAKEENARLRDALTALKTWEPNDVVLRIINDALGVKE
jgi:hypothetical protein